MNRYLRSLLTVTIVVSLITILLSQNPLRAKAAKTIVTWFVGLGTGTNEEQLNVQEKLIKKFNAQQDSIELKLFCACGVHAAPAELGTLIATDKPPDIVGPVGFEGAHQFAGQW